ncbi:unnamed protein product [Tilletia caries]|uniref:Nuclear control of ATPase protein 2 n=1 Tax=Tilletia caries TaxID=13290 RepID=A0ABN7IW36_9BASI|nr:unnamed protein product [Tilletia caries]CAD7067171.1 unnamed protein product [Tilletia caries]
MADRTNPKRRERKREHDEYDEEEEERGKHSRLPHSPSSSSSSFAVDAIRTLGSQLDAIERSRISTSSTSTAADSETVTTAVKQEQGQARTDDQASGDNSASSVLDISQITANHPTTADLLQILSSLHPSIVLMPSSGAGPTADTVFALTRIALATYTAFLDTLLQDAHAVEASAWGWHDIHDDDNHLAALTYLVQTLPARTWSLSQTAVRILRSSQVPASFSTQSIQTVLHSLKKSPALLTTALFPLSASGPAPLASGEGGAAVTTIGIGRVKFGFNPLRAPRAFDPVRLAAHEARSKAQILLAERDALATQLGTLAQQLPTLVSSTRDAEGTTSQKSAVSEYEAAVLVALQSAGRAVRHIQSALEQEPIAKSPSPSDLYDVLHSLLSTSIPQYTSATHTSLSVPTSVSNLSALGEPSLFLRLWLPAIILPASALVLRSTIIAQWDRILATVTDAKETIRGFWVGWVVQPGAQLLRTLRRGEAERGLIIAKESLASDLKSLERMVTSFSAEKYNLSPDELEDLAAKVRDGDLTSVLRVYEDEMRSPLKSAFTGSLLRALLIQVQKAKVDLEVAMSGIDRLLRSQELLIGAVGLAPAVAIVWVTTKWALSGGRFGGGRRRQLREGESEIDKLLSLPGASSGSSTSSTDTLPPLTHGLLLLHLSFLRSAADPLTAFYARASPQKKAIAKRLRRAFLQDIRELEAAAAATGWEGEDQKEADARSGSGSDAGPGMGSVGLGWQVRRATIQRMWSSWQGLLVPRGVGM